MIPMNCLPEGWNWLESSGGYSRYDTGNTGDSQSVWLHDECGEEVDPDEGCCCCEDEDEDFEVEEDA